jgi:hypothetical protein
MARRSTRRRPSSSAPLTLPAELPDGPVPIDTGTAEVIRDPDFPQRVTLHVNGVPSSSLDLADPGFLDFEYMQQMAAFVALLPPGPLRVLHLGAAGSAFARLPSARRRSRCPAARARPGVVRPAALAAAPPARRRRRAHARVRP